MIESEDHRAFREQVRRFVQREIEPNIDAWEAAEEIDRDLYRKAAEAGILGIGFPEEFGGIDVGGDPRYALIATEEQCRAGSGGLVASLFSLGIALPPIVALGSAALKQRVLPDVLAGRKIAALAITEPGGGSEVANLRTTAVRDGDDYILNGSKTFITSGMRADWITTAVRTGGDGMGGISLLAVPGDAPGLSRTKLKKMGWWCSDTATLYFDNCRVPAELLVGSEGAGFMGIMRNFNSERLALAAQAVGLAQCALDEARDWAQQRKTFGKRLADHQVIRHKLVDMQMQVEAARAYLDAVTDQVAEGQAPIAQLCMLKNLATSTLESVAADAVQILGGRGYMRETKSERIFRETKVLSIGGGASEIMKDLAARQLGL